MSLIVRCDSGAGRKWAPGADVRRLRMASCDDAPGVRDGWHTQLMAKLCDGRVAGNRPPR